MYASGGDDVQKGQMPVLQITGAVQKGQNKVPDDT